MQQSVRKVMRSGQQTRIRPITSGQSFGLSLMELMVGLTIGLVVSTAAVGSLVFMQSSSRLTGEASRMQQDATLAFNLIGQYIRSSGSVNLARATDGGVTFIRRELFSGISANSNNATVRAILRNGNEVLQLATSHSRDSGINGMQSDCLGNDVSAIPTLLTEFVWDSATRELRCGRGYTPQDEAGAPLQTVIGNVAQLVMHYGVRHSDNQLRYQRREIMAGDDWALVQSVRICMILNSQAPVDEFHNLFKTSSLHFDDCDSTDDLKIDRTTIANDPQRRLYRLYRQVFTIRPAST